MDSQKPTSPNNQTNQPLAEYAAALSRQYYDSLSNTQVNAPSQTPDYAYRPYAYNVQQTYPYLPYTSPSQPVPSSAMTYPNIHPPPPPPQQQQQAYPNYGIGNPYERTPKFSCEPCKKVFYQHHKYQEHLSNHRKCFQCDFSAINAIVLKHEEAVHGKKINPLLNVSLDTPEEIEKWREERRKRYPTEVNIQKKKDEEKLKCLKKRRGIEEEPLEMSDPVMEEGELLEESDGSGVERKPKKHKPHPCKYFLKGKCRKGDQCSFSHEKQVKKKLGLFQTLLEQDLEKERIQVFQFIHYLFEKSLLQNTSKPDHPVSDPTSNPPL